VQLFEGAKMISARQSKRLLAAVMASSIAVVDVHAAITDIYNQPLATTSTVVAKPNIMFILDNSGSMADANMPDEMSDTGKYGYWSAQCNGVAFDPTYNYEPPVKPDGTSFPDINFRAAPDDGFTNVGSTARSSSTSLAVGTGSMVVSVSGGSLGSTSYAVNNPILITSQVDPLVWMSGLVTAYSYSSGTGTLTVDVTKASGTGTLNAWTVSFGTDLNNKTYYTYTGSQPALNWTYNTSGVIANTFYNECMSNTGSSPGSGVFTLQTVSTASTATVQQNYANWRAYYRTRRLLMRTAAGRAFQTLNSDFRVGFTTISDTGATNGTNKFLDVADYDSAQKTAFYSNLYTATGSSFTPLRASLAKVGRYFANKAPGQTSDPMQYSCQRNFAILSTDGYWNTNSESGTYGPFQATSNTNVGQQDGSEVRPMNDGGTATTTTVTTTTTTTRQQVVTSNRATTTYRRYVWTIGNTLTTCGGNNNRYTMSIQQQNRSATADTTTTTVQDVVTTSQRTVVRNAATGTIISDNTTNSSNTSTVSNNTVNDASSTGTFANSGGAVGGCASPTGLANEGLSSGSTVYSTTSDTTCTGSGCNYNATGGGASAGGSATGTTNTVLSGPMTTVLSGPTTTVAETVTNTSSGGVSNTLADVAEYYYITDLRTTAFGNCTSGSSGNDVCANNTMLPNPPLDTATHQHMTTYTVGLGVSGTLAYDANYLTQTSGTYVNLTNGSVVWPDPIASAGAARIDDLWHAAVNGRGRYFATKNATTLSNALASTLAEAAKVTGSAAGAATNSLEPVLGGDNKAYIATYTTVEWTGDVRAYPLDAATGNIDVTTATWSAKTMLEGTSAGSRNIKYMHPTTKALRSFTYSNLSTDGYGPEFTGICSKSPAPLQCGTLSTAQITLADDGNNLVNFLRGDAAYEAETNITNPLYRERAAKLGDIINASPVYLKKSPLKYTDSGYTSFVTATGGRKGMLYAAANDGMLHAFDASTGAELWAFVPSFVMPNLYKLADTDYRNRHRYFVDGSPIVADIYTGSAWKTILVGGLNAGGKGYYALDVTDPDNPVGLWEFTDANMGLTYGNPIVTKRADGTWVVAVTSGLNNADGVGRLYLLNAATGALVTSMSTATGTATDPSGLNKINAWVDSGSNNTAKRFYGGDMLGNLWRFDFDDQVPPAGAEVTKLATFQISAGTPQPITTKPQLTVVTASGGTKVPVIVVATGRYLGTSDVSDTTVQSIYAIKDPLTGTGWGDVRTRSDLVVQTVTVSGVTGTGTSNAIDWNTNIGWRMDLPQSKERVVTNFLVNFNVVTVASAIPGSNECNPSGGASWIYEISVGTGRAANGTSVSSYLGAFLVVGISAIMATDGNLRQIIVGSDASVRTREPTPVGLDSNNVRRSAWRELIN
jgi:type IV pilus assembly protein PilY1